ncbi:folate family ECF transporter S component [Streptococcus plurextorum]|uniref:folate family ECF transporter S component n=1 Tax=Streptococcus plurextorum TaxID=456876 RepID=UPI0003FA286F|nr:folate family ECF transporter S component [Streptococcus plurextorum]
MTHKLPKLTLQRLAAIAAVLALLIIVENYFTLKFSDSLQFQFTFIPYAILGAIAGPVWGGIASIGADVIGNTMNTSQFLIGFVLIEAVKGLIYGWFYYQKPLDSQDKKDWFYVGAVVLLLQLVISFGLTPVVLHTSWGTPLEVLYTTRLIKAPFEITLQVMGTMLIIPQLQRIPELRKLMGLSKK